VPETDPPPVRSLSLLIVDDHEVVRQGLVAVFERRPGFHVVAEAGTVAEAVEAARRFRPDLVVMDVRLPDGSGVEACREIRAELPDTKVIAGERLPPQAGPRPGPGGGTRGRGSRRIAA
jgi:two-component system response regulator DevR